MEASCPGCGSERVVRNGKNTAGEQTYLCKACGRRFRPGAVPVAHSEEVRQQVFTALQERSSIRGVQRQFGIHRNTVIRWLNKKPNS